VCGVGDVLEITATNMPGAKFPYAFRSFNPRCQPPVEREASDVIGGAALSRQKSLNLSAPVPCRPRCW
jgi:hypothetical protein